MPHYTTLPTEMGLVVAAFLDVKALAAMHAAGGECLPDRAWRAHIPTSRSLFRLHRPKPFTTARDRFIEWAAAKRTDLAVAPGTFLFAGTCRDRKGLVVTTGFKSWCTDLDCMGRVQHKRMSTGAATDGAGSKRSARRASRRGREREAVRR